MKKEIVWKQEHVIEINGYVGKEHVYSINSFYNRNYARPINNRYKGETWITYKGVCFKLDSVKEAKELCSIIHETGKPPKHLRALMPRVWAVWHCVIFPSFFGDGKKKALDTSHIGFPVELTEIEYPSYAQRTIHFGK